MGTQDESGQTADGPSLSRGPGRGWKSSLWPWPGAAIGLATIAGTLFGPFGVLLSAEALAVILVAAGIFFLSQDRWLTFGLAAALTLSVVVIASSIRVHQSNGESSNKPNLTARDARNLPANWSGQVISQAMADEADFRGADLDGAKLNGIQLSHKDLDGVQANGASFHGSQLEYASLRGASLRGACLEGANLTGADLSGADFSGADVAGVIVTQQAKRAALAWPAIQPVQAVACSLEFMRASRMHLGPPGNDVPQPSGEPGDGAGEGDLDRDHDARQDARGRGSEGRAAARQRFP